MRGRITALLMLLAVAGCDQTDPYLRAGVWHPKGVNEANLRTMAAAPSDLALARPAAHGDGHLAAAAVARLRHDQVKPLPDSGVAAITPVSNGTVAAPPAAAASPSGSPQ